MIDGWLLVVVVIKDEVVVGMDLYSGLFVVDVGVFLLCECEWFFVV